MTELSRDTAPVSAIIPTWNRTARLADTLRNLKACHPAPAEILVHIDAGDDTTRPWLMTHHPDVRVLESRDQVGPGGGRNRLIREARYGIIASFDDDSYPVDPDFFDRLLLVFGAFPDAAVLSCAIYHQGETIKPDTHSAGWTSNFVGCGCAYHRDAFLALDGYLNLPIAYGAEEADVAIQLQERGKAVLHSDWLRVYHDTVLTHHEAPDVNGAKIANLALLAYVRYPVSMWGYGALQVLNRVSYALKNGRHAGILHGLGMIPSMIWTFRRRRRPVSREALERYLASRSGLTPLPWPAQLSAERPQPTAD